jgi:hypothetical protein
MSQNRDAPAYQEYAAAMMAKLSYRTLNLQERGLLWTMRNECWVNSTLPSKPELLAKVLGFDTEDVTASLPAVMPFFAIDGQSIISPDLEAYRAYLKDRKERMADGGKRGADAANRKRKRSNTDTGSDDSATPQPP